MILIPAMVLVSVALLFPPLKDEGLIVGDRESVVAGAGEGNSVGTSCTLGKDVSAVVGDIEGIHVVMNG